MNIKRILTLTVLMVVLTLALSSTAAASKPGQAVLTANSSPPTGEGYLAKVVAIDGAIEWRPLLENDGFTLAVALPDDSVYQQSFEAGITPVFHLLKDGKQEIPNGLYLYELRLTPVIQPEVRLILQEVAEANNRSEVVAQLQREGKLPQHALVQTGSFYLQDGQVILPGPASETEQKPGAGKNQPASESPIMPEDIVHADDVIITGSLCVGFDCLTDGNENFGFDAIKLKENNLRLFFDDTSDPAIFPANDWRIITNDSTSGGANYFSIEDSTAARRIFSIEAGGVANSLYVQAGGRIGFNTAIPVLALHIVKGDTPSLRLEQDTSSGWPAQVWDIAGNESGFFIRDTTNSSKMPFRIQPNSPTNSFTIKSDGRIGFGTWSPAYSFELERTGEAATVVVDRTDGAEGGISADVSSMNIGSISNHPVEFMVNNIPFLTIQTNGRIGVGTLNPDFPFELERTGLDALLVVDRTDGARGAISASLDSVIFGSITNHPVEFIVNDTPVAWLNAGGHLTLDGYLTELSDVNAKQMFTPVDNRLVLEKVTRLPIQTWSYKSEPAGVRHMGPVAQDFYTAFGLGTDALHIAPLDMNGVALASIQALNVKVLEKEAKISQLEAQVKTLENRISTLETRGNNPLGSPLWSQLSPLAFGLLGLIAGIKFVNRKK